MAERGSGREEDTARTGHMEGVQGEASDGADRAGKAPGTRPLSRTRMCPAPAQLSWDALTILWGCQQLGPGTRRSKTALGGRAEPWRTARSQEP